MFYKEFSILIFFQRKAVFGKQGISQYIVFYFYFWKIWDILKMNIHNLGFNLDQFGTL